MSDNPFERTEMLYGDTAVSVFRHARIAVIGLGGVGSFVVEGLARSGIGFFRLVDFDRIHTSNLNRQLVALHSTLGEFKAEAMRVRVLDINPEATVEVITEFCGQDSRQQWLRDIDYLVDAIDSLNPKAGLLADALSLGVPVISAMGAAGRRDPSRVRLGWLSETRVCPLATRLRKAMRHRGIDTPLQCAWSDEPPVPQRDFESGSHDEWELDRGRKRGTLPSGVIVPAVMGLTIAGYVLEQLTKKKA